MKKKIFLIISYALQILICFYVFAYAQNIVQSTINALQAYSSLLPSDVMQRTLNIFVNNGAKYIYTIASINLILNLLSLIIVLKANILQNKGKLIAFSVISIFTSALTVSEILAIVNIIVLAVSKRKNPEDFPVKKEIPKIEFQNSTKKEKIWSIILILTYCIIFGASSFLPDDFNLTAYYILSILIYIFLIVLSIFVFKDKLKHDVKLFKNNFSAYMRFILPKIGIIYLIELVATVIVSFYAKNLVSVNQQTLEQLPAWFLLPVAIIYAPIVEEAIFRGSLRRFIKNDIIFIIISAISFGLLHTLKESSVAIALVKSIPYAVIGGGFAYIYKKSNNICSNMFAHFFYNIIAATFTVLFTTIIF